MLEKLCLPTKREMKKFISLWLTTYHSVIIKRHTKVPFLFIWIRLINNLLMHLGILVVENKQLNRISPDKESCVLIIFIISAIPLVTWDASLNAPINPYQFCCTLHFKSPVFPLFHSHLCFACNTFSYTFFSTYNIKIDITLHAPYTVNNSILSLTVT